MAEEVDQEFCIIISSRKAPQSFSFSYKTAVLEGKKINLEELKSLNPSWMNENNHYVHMPTQERDKAARSLSSTGVWYFKTGKQLSYLFCQNA